MIKAVGVYFKKGGKIYNFDLNGLESSLEDKLIVETDRGIELVFIYNFFDYENVENRLSKILRIATESDIKKYNKNIKDAESAINKAKKFAEEIDLDMKFTEASFSLDRTQLVLYFLSNNRVDFRELAKLLASVYKTRIELRQIGVRDKAKEVSGIGPCGLKLCCSNFLCDLDSVNIESAKNQNIVLNPNKINGLCGRLLCCLNYEDELYKENKKIMPEVGKTVKTKEGEGVVTFVDIPNMKYTVYVENVGKVIVDLNEKKRKHNK